VCFFVVVPDAEDAVAVPFETLPVVDETRVDDEFPAATVEDDGDDDDEAEVVGGVDDPAGVVADEPEPDTGIGPLPLP
jgi:hypothetical protein